MIDNYLPMISRMFDHIIDFFVYFYNQGLSMFYFFGTPISEQNIPNDIEDLLLMLGFTLEETPFELCFGPLLFTVFMISVIKTIMSVVPMPG